MLRQLGLLLETPLLVETTDDGAIVLRQVSAYPIEIYSDERLAEFERENELMPEPAKIPDEGLKRRKAGNARFVASQALHCDLLEHLLSTAK